MDPYNPFLSFLPNYAPSNIFADSGFRFYNYTPNGNTNPVNGLDNTQIDELNEAKETAKVKGDISTVKVIDSIFKYGGSLVLLLSQIGVIKNKNITSLKEFTADGASLSGILARTGGSLDPESVQRIAKEDNNIDRSTSLLGVPFSYIIIALVGTLIYSIYSNKSTKKAK